MWQDLRYAARFLARAPMFALVSATALALGIGANTAIFSVVYAVLLRPLPFPDPERLVAVWESSLPRQAARSFVSPANFLDWKEQAGSFSSMAALQHTDLNLTGGFGEPEQLEAERVSLNLFEVLGVRAAVGRTFRPGEEQDRVAILSDRLWKRRFGGDPSVAGRVIRLNGQDWTVAGVLPAAYESLRRGIDVWVPLAWQPAAVYRGTGARYLTVVARLKPGVPLRQAQAELEAIAARLEQAYPALNDGWTVRVLPLHEEMVGDVRRGLLVLLGAVAFLLLIACANVANLLLARAAARQREMAVRAAVGASRTRIVRQLLAESVLLAGVGGAAGLALAMAGVRLFTALGPRDIPRIGHAGLNLAVLAFTAVVSLATGVLFGLAPALELSRPDLSGDLKEGGRGSTAGSFRREARHLLIGFQVALAVVLLIGAGLMGRSFLRLRAVDPGLEPANLLTMRILLPQRTASEAQRVAFFQGVLERVRGAPGVRAAGAVNYLPLTGLGTGATFAVEGQPATTTAHKPTALVRSVDTDYFRAAGIPLLRGRSFTAYDGAAAPKVVVVSRALARRFFPAGDALGARLALDFRQPVTAQVIGIVGDVHAEGLHAAPWPLIYCPHPQLPSTFMNLVVRTSSDPARMAAAIAREVQAIRPGLPVTEARTMQQVLEASLATPQFDMLLLAVFGAVALVLASVGIYGLMAYTVTERTHEIGIRMALGARRGDVYRLVVGRAALLALGGILLGVATAYALSRVMAGLLYGIAATDALTFIAVPLVLAAVAVAASYIPARRAVRIDPMAALRHE